MKRREALRHTITGAAGLLLADSLRPLAPELAASASTLPLAHERRAETPRSAPRQGRAASVIQVWLWGGPSQLDTFDPKPAAGYDYCGPFATPLVTKVDGLLVNELLPRLAEAAHLYSVIRSMTHGINAHETAAYAVQTGRLPGGKDVYPSVGAVVSLFRGYGTGYAGLIPPYIVLTRPQGRFSEAGFLGPRYAPFATGGDPAQPRFVVEGVVAEGITEAHQQSRRELLQRLRAAGTGGIGSLDAFLRSEAQAYDLILGDAGKVFDLSQETDAVRERYGRNTLGQSCLVARRLVERGVPYITINSEGWDTHRQHFQAMRQRLPQLDAGLSSLLQDLDERGLLDSTIVWCGGEFGRTPRVDWQPPWNGGRGHFGAVFSTLVAGGGFQGGRVLGASDERGETVRERPVTPQELIATIYHLLGIGTEAVLPHPQGEAVPAAPPLPSGEAAGLLRELL